MLKTIAGLQGVTILSKEAQKKVQGGVVQCGVVLHYFNGGFAGGWLSTDADHNGRTKDNARDAVADINGNNDYAGAGMYATYCCDSCSNYPIS